MNRKVTDYIQEFGTDSVNEEFISKEELKDKINKKIREYDYQLGEFSYTKKYRQIKEERIEELKEILKLLESEDI